jgi:glycosyltransferase involved in cell wall biosynthesis
LHTEVIIVDDGSTDDTMAICSEYGHSFYERKGRGMSENTNFGIHQSRGDYIYRVDSDVILDHDIIKKSVDLLEYGSVDCVCVMWIPDPTISFWARVRKMELECYRNNPYPRGARFLRRSVIESIGYFNPDLVAGEDYDVYNKLVEKGFKITTVDSYETHLGEPRSAMEIIKKNFFYGTTIRRYLASSRTASLAQFNPITKQMLINRNMLSENPGLIIGFMIYKILVYTSTCAGYMASYFGKYKSTRSRYEG